MKLIETEMVCPFCGTQIQTGEVSLPRHKEVGEWFITINSTCVYCGSTVTLETGKRVRWTVDHNKNTVKMEME